VVYGGVLRHVQAGVADFQGCVQLRLSGWGRLVPSYIQLILWGQAVPTQSKSTSELELDAALAGFEGGLGDVAFSGAEG
jgi:hypothetical protein